ncbi:MAG TPA: hypothetical protein VGC42_23335, partial [Kofleriaceae bacterium]
MADSEESESPPQASVDLLDYSKHPPKETRELFAHLVYRTARNVKQLLIKLEVFKEAPDAPPIRGKKPAQPTAFFLQPLAKAKDDDPHEFIYQQKVKSAHTYRFTVYGTHQPKGPEDELYVVTAHSLQAVTTSGGAVFQLSYVPSEGPRLVLAVNETKVDPAPAAGATDADTVLAICAYVEARLLDDNGFGAVWTTPSGVNKTLLGVASPRERLDEQWAQLVSERLCYSVYGGPTQAYGLVTGWSDHDIYKRLLDEADPVYPLSQACQHTATFCAVARGFDTAYEASGSQTKSLVEQGMKKQAKGGPVVQVIPPVPGVKFRLPSDAGGSYGSTQDYLLKKDFALDLPKLDELLADDITPGSCFVSGVDHLFGEYPIWCPLPNHSPTETVGRNAYIFHPESAEVPLKLKNPIDVPGQVSYSVTKGSAEGHPLYRIRTGYLGAPVKTSEAHIAAILRVDKTNKRLQAFDTGGGLGRGQYDATPASLAPMGSTSVHQESGWADKTAWFHMQGYAGHAILPQASDDQLDKAVKRLRRTRALGMMQLVVLRRPEPGAYTTGYATRDIVWAGKLVPMHLMSGGAVTSVFT